MTELRLLLIILGTVLLLGIYYWGRRSRKAEAEQEYVRGEEDWLEKLAEQRQEEIPSLTPVLDEHGEPQRVEPLIGDLELDPEPAAERPAPYHEPELKVESHGIEELIEPEPSEFTADEARTNADMLFLEEVEPSAPEPEPAPPARESEPGEELILVLNVMAHDNGRFAGMDIHRAMAQCGLHHGDMNIYHQHVENNGSGPVVFSVANVVEPGSFDPASMDEFSTPGLVLFLRLPAAIDGEKAFEKMLASARLLAQQLDGELKDETRSTLTQQTIGHLREKVAAFQFKQQLAQPKD